MGVRLHGMRALFCSVVFTVLVSGTASAQIPSPSSHATVADAVPLITGSPPLERGTLVPATVGMSASYIERWRRLAAVRAVFASADDLDPSVMALPRPRRDVPRRAFSRDAAITVSGWRIR